jgi:arabinogalactan endo-1,4-beta-galactosidase
MFVMGIGKMLLRFIKVDRAVREVSANSNIDTKIILHIAQPENVEWWFQNMSTIGGVSDFDIIGFSYYSQWSDVPLEEISNYVSDFLQTFNKEVMIMETAYSWTLGNADNYGNIFGENSLVDGYPASKEGQLDFMTDLTLEVINGGGTGIMYWEPAWITSGMKDLWGTGSSWENNTFFDFEGRVHTGIDYMTKEYELE